MQATSRWRIRALAFVAQALRPTSAQQLNETTTVIERSRVLAHVGTYRNAYGTHFECTSTCYFTMWAYLACVAVLLALLAVIPVQSPSKLESAPFALWPDDNNPANEDSVVVSKKKAPRRVYGVLDQLSMWWHGYEEAASSDSEESRGTFHEDIDLLADQAPVQAKTFESIGVETDDSLLPRLFIDSQGGQDSIVLVDDVDKLFNPLPPSPRTKKPGIFAPVTPRDDSSKTTLDAGDSDGDPSRRRSVAPLARQASIAESTAGAGRRATIVGSTVSDTTRENVLTAVERRTSMHKRAEKRKEYAKSDIAHDNLHEHELHMYEYLEFVRSLLEGIALKKITQKSGKVVKRTFFITPNLVTVYWNKVGNKGWVSKKSSIESTDISHVTKGAEGANSVKPENQELCITIVMNDRKRLVLQAKDAGMRQRLFLGFSRLAVEKKEEKRKREAGELDDSPQYDAESEEAPPKTTVLGEQQIEEEEEEKGETLPTIGTQEPETTAEAERRAKSEEDDPKRWRVEPQEGRHRVDEDDANQTDRLEEAVLVSDED